MARRTKRRDKGSGGRRSARAGRPGGRAGDPGGSHGTAGAPAGARGRAGDPTALPSLPDLPSLRDLPVWDDLKPSAAQAEEFGQVRDQLVDAGGVGAEELCLGCVVRLDRGFPAVVTSHALVRAEFAARLTKSPYSKVAVGDWVCLRMPSGHQMAQVIAILRRANDVARWRGGSRGERQTLAANVDRVLVVQALGPEGVSLERIARSALIAADCHADVAVVLTKADRVGAESLERAVASVRELLGEGAPVVVTSAQGPREEGDDSGVDDVPEPDGADAAGRACADGAADVARCQAIRAAGALWGFDHVVDLVPAGTVAIVLGESGAGKSTMLNALLGHEALETGAVRARDDAGRHTTVARRMVRLSQGGVIVDEPGLRSLPIVGHERGLALLFPEVAEAACRCRFRDCTHTHEPGCAVLSARDQGACLATRVDAYVALAGEMRANAGSLDPDIVL